MITDKHLDFKDIAAVYNLIQQNKTKLVIEGDVECGYMAAYMLVQCWFDPNFHFYGVCSNPEELDAKVSEKLPHLSNSFIQPGLVWSNNVKTYLRGKIEKQSKPIIWLCSGKDLDKQDKCFHAGMELLGCGDYIIAFGLPTRFRLNTAHKYVLDEKLQRITGGGIPSDLFIGKVL